MRAFVGLAFALRRPAGLAARPRSMRTSAAACSAVRVPPSPRRLHTASWLGTPRALRVQVWRGAARAASTADPIVARVRRRRETPEPPKPHEEVPAEPQDEEFMRRALRLAREAAARGEVPIGAVVVRDGEVVAEGANEVEGLRDATAHAEILAIRSASRAVENWRLEGTTLYCTLEPCSMCLGAMLLARVGRVVYGAPDLRHGAMGSWVHLLEAGPPHPMHPSLRSTRGVLAEDSAELMRAFFRARRAATEAARAEARGVGSAAGSGEATADRDVNADARSERSSRGEGSSPGRGGGDEACGQTREPS
eukprot:tig00021742_g23312.t1